MTQSKHIHAKAAVLWRGRTRLRGWVKLRRALRRAAAFLLSDAPGHSAWVDTVLRNGIQPGQRDKPWRER